MPGVRDMLAEFGAVVVQFARRKMARVNQFCDCPLGKNCQSEDERLVSTE